MELVCTTERERFVVPVRAVGVRALLDFPDEIHFPSSPVKVYTKTIEMLHQHTHTPSIPLLQLQTVAYIYMYSCVQYSSSKTILVRNVGDKEAKFTLYTQR